MSISKSLMGIGLAYLLASLATDNWGHKISKPINCLHIKTLEACAHTSVLAADDCIANGRRSLTNNILDHSRKVN